MRPQPISYAPPDTRRAQALLVRCLMLGTWAYPLVPIGLLYATWFVAWSQLGHRPVCMMDDPKNIGGWVDAAYILTATASFTSPPACIGSFLVGLLATPWWIQSKRGSGFASVIGAFAIFVWYAAAVIFLRLDPWGVLCWFMD